ncbi:MAG: ATP-binding protein [Deltaproteobacteria bacterium]|nr:ATP-binding protein [Deltaproteobacteria bacterium]
MPLDTRSLEPVLHRDLKKKFVFLTGPRQVGKTTLAKKIVQAEKGRYLLYDDEEDRRTILKKEYTHHAWVCLDEFHKYSRWKNHIKGVYDKYKESLHLLLTGSARLDIYQKSGDSLFGRYYLHHLHPLTLGEIESQNLPPFLTDPHQMHGPRQGIKPLLKFGGFPEPFFSQSETEHRRWSNARRQLLIREDLRDLTQIELISLVEHLMLLLPDRIGSLFSFRSLAEDLQVSPPTIKSWMDVFGQLFLTFSLKPHTKKIVRSLHKQAKYYLYDWSQIPDEGNRFENLVASHLWKAVQVWTDLGEANLGLAYIRDRTHRETDFLITKEGKPWFLVEAKLAETQISDNLRYFAKRLNVPAIQMIQKEEVVKQVGNILVVSANRWLANLP